MYNCDGCGAKCCKLWSTSISISQADLAKWEDTNMMDYLVDDKAWFDPETKVQLTACPFLLNNKCSIHPKDSEIDMRPEVCGQYPMGKPCLDNKTTVSCGDGYEIEFAVFKRE